MLTAKQRDALHIDMHEKLRCFEDGYRRGFEDGQAIAPSHIREASPEQRAKRAEAEAAKNASDSKRMTRALRLVGKLWRMYRARINERAATKKRAGGSECDRFRLLEIT